MQITATKAGTILKLTKTEERKLRDAEGILQLIATHADQEVVKYASEAYLRLGSVLSRVCPAPSAVEV